jgi:hypothetical protein
MNRKKIDHIIQAGRLPYNSDFWWDYIMGTTVLTMILWGIGMLTLLKIGFTDDLMIPFLIIIIGLISIKFYFDHKVQQIETGLNKKENIELICKTLQELNWKHKKYANTVELEYEKYILKWTNVSFIPLDDRIIYCFQYHSTANTGRFPIFIGIRTYLKRKFEKKLHTTMAKMHAQPT